MTFAAILPWNWLLATGELLAFVAAAAAIAVGFYLLAMVVWALVYHAPRAVRRGFELGYEKTRREYEKDKGSPTAEQAHRMSHPPR